MLPQHQLFLTTLLQSKTKELKRQTLSWGVHFMPRTREATIYSIFPYFSHSERHHSKAAGTNWSKFRGELARFKGDWKPSPIQNDSAMPSLQKAQLNADTTVSNT